MRTVRWMWMTTLVALALSGMLGAGNPVHAQSLAWLGTFGGSESMAFGVSADGAVVVGMARNTSNRMRAFRWTQNDGLQDLGTFGGSEGAANGVSADGVVVVGGAADASGRWRAFRWTQGGGMQSLGTLGGSESVAFGASTYGSVIVGWAYNAYGWLHAFRWENGVMHDLGTLSNSEGWWSAAYGVSGSGSVVVGESGSSSQRRAFRWTQSGGMQNLGAFGGTQSLGNGVSADGRVVVGAARNASGQLRAFRWTQSGGLQDLGTLGGTEGWASAASADGHEVAGMARNASGQWRAFRWTPPAGMVDLNQAYAHLLTNGSRLEEAYAISTDGRYIAGIGYNAATRRREAYLLDTAPSCIPHSGDVDDNGCVDDADLLAVLFAFGNSGSNLGRVDANCDNAVDDADMLVVLFNFGQGCDG